MTPTKAKLLTPGTILAAKMFRRGRVRVEVQAIKVQSPRVVQVTVKNDDGHTRDYRNDELDFVTEEDDVRWTYQATVKARGAAFEAEMARVQAAVGVKPSPNYQGYASKPTTYTVTLTQAEALALTARIEALEAAAK